MSISIVTVTYNSSSKILPLLKSINKQVNVGKIEVIIIDNNSPDQKILIKKISDYKSVYKNINIRTKYQNTNDGFGVSCNYGVRLSSYGSIIFLNPDTELLPNSLSILINHAKIHDADICGGKSLHSNSNKIHRTVFFRPTIKTMLFEFSNLGKIFKKSGNFYYGQGKIRNDIPVEGIGGVYFYVKKSSFAKLSGFDKKIFMYLEDVDICVRAMKMNMKILYCPHSIIKHIGGASSDNKYHIVHNAWYNSREYYVRKHFPIAISFLICLLYKIERMLLEYRQKIMTS